MCNSSVVSQILEQAEARAQSTLHTCWPTDSDLDDPGRRELSAQVLTQFRILFLFPQLPDWQRGFLATVYWQRQALEQLLHHPPHHQSVAMRVQTEHVTCQLEHSFMYLVAQMKSLAVYAVLSPMQQDVLESEFLQIKFLDASR